MGEREVCAWCTANPESCPRHPMTGNAFGRGTSQTRRRSRGTPALIHTIRHRATGAPLYSCEAKTLRAAVKQAVLRDANLTGANLADADLAHANLAGADLADADLAGANLAGADLAGADLAGADLARADLAGANLADADLADADLAGANLAGADLAGADLADAVLPDGRTLAAYLLDPLAGICDDPEARARAIAAWGHHTWQDCPLHAAHGWTSTADAAADRRLAAAAFVALFDAGLLPQPQEVAYAPGIWRGGRVMASVITDRGPVQKGDILMASEKKNPVFEVGAKVLVRTVTMIDLGEVVGETDAFVLLRNGGWVADTGRLGLALETGKVCEFERAPGAFAISKGSIVDVFPWGHPIPKETI